MIIKNNAPAKMILYPPVVGYTKIRQPHDNYTDLDVRGRLFKTYDASNQLLSSEFVPLNETTYYDLSNLVQNTTYKLRGGFVDEMVSDDMFPDALGIYLSDLASYTTKTMPWFKSITVESNTVEVGVASPKVLFSVGGDATYISIFRKPSGSPTTPWDVIFVGGINGDNPIPITMEPGTYDFMVQGRIIMGSGFADDVSTADVETGIEVSYQFTPPATPTNLEFGVVKVSDGKERYDLKVTWDWVQGASSSIKSFVLQYVSESEYITNGWSNPSVINTSSSTQAVITGFPFGQRHRFRVLATIWGPEADSTSTSGVFLFTLDKDSAIEHEISVDTAIEVNYSHIRAYYINEQDVKVQTFNIDAATGSVSLGMLDAQGKAPILIDPVGNTVSVDGSVIANNITAASIVLANLTGTQNPVIRTSTKPTYGANAQGMWAGFDDSDGKFKFDLGDAAKYIRWDGEKLLISSEVQVGVPGGGSVPIGEIGGGGGGPGIFSQPVDNFSGFDATLAQQWFDANYGGEISKYATLTQYDSVDHANSETKQWDGTQWIAPTLLVHGSTIVTGSLTAEALIADSAFLNKMGVNVIYDNPALQTPDPEANFKMKIDLENGSIFIR